MSIVEIAKMAGKKINKCPVCGCDRLWLKYITVFNRKDNMSELGILYKCDRCAYVNTDGYLNVTVPFIVSAADYTNFFDKPKLVDLRGKIVPYSGYRYIGRDFWNIPDIRKPEGLKCKCGADMDIVNYNPFYRTKFVDDQYRCDILCKCEKGHTLAFGVHISKDDYEELVVRLRRG